MLKKYNSKVRRRARPGKAGFVQGRRALLSLFALLLFSVAIVLRQVFPLEFNDRIGRAKLWWAGIRQTHLKLTPSTSEEVGLPGLHVFTREFRGNMQGVVQGNGNTPIYQCVVLIHGLGDTAQTWNKMLSLPKATWGQNLEVGIRLVAVDLPGSGDSQGPKDPKAYRVRNMAERVNQELVNSYADCVSWTAVGNSLGGWVATWMSLIQGSPIRQLFLLSPAGLKTLANTNAALISQPTIESLQEFQRKAYFKPRPIPEEIWKKIVQRAQKSNARQVVQAQVPEDFLEPYLSQLNIPVKILWGEADQVLPPEMGKKFETMITGSQLTLLPQCGHLPQKECPDYLLRVLREGLSERR